MWWSWSPIMEKDESGGLGKDIDSEWRRGDVLYRWPRRVIELYHYKAKERAK